MLTGAIGSKEMVPRGHGSGQGAVQRSRRGMAVQGSGTGAGEAAEVTHTAGNRDTVAQVEQGAEAYLRGLKCISGSREAGSLLRTLRRSWMRRVDGWKVNKARHGRNVVRHKAWTSDTGHALGESGSRRIDRDARKA